MEEFQDHVCDTVYGDFPTEYTDGRLEALTAFTLPERAYVLSGAFHLEYGPGGRESTDIRAGEYFSVAGGAVHREGTVGDVPCSVVAVRVGEGPPYRVARDGPEPG